MIPDARCEYHGEMYILYETTSRGEIIYRKYCRSCKREEARARKGGLVYNSPLDPHCKNGHPKTRFNHRIYGGKLQCVPCSRERGRHKR